ncbi:DUF2020 domain-containing protein [Corynebacterium stationis]|uniref:DUF2020 domain-containing protein n=1 Tax=Corynebacterium stationis TaxID=1705 RepID=A0AB36CJI6_9CORY|nr:DUF2020 domain-containing protein [Corynebacterium stationis]NME88983.1 DUF2020 domain-containing protein [Corynebacterium stationis]
MPLSLLPRAISLVVAAGVLSSCAADTPTDPNNTSEASPSSPAISSAPVAPRDGLAVDALPEVGRGGQEACPYLDTQFVADANGQRVTDFGVDTRFNPPGCVFYSYPDEPQLIVMVRRLSSFGQAMEVVDFAAPIDSTSPAEYGEWDGGRGALGGIPTGAGSVFAVAKDSMAVVVWSNQEQSVKAETIAKQVIINLGL